MESECFVDQSEDKEKEREDAVKTDGAKSDASSEHEVSGILNLSLLRNILRNINFWIKAESSEPSLSRCLQEFLIVK